ncbi:unnamed protein product [Arabidopsis halleri]
MHSLILLFVFNLCNFTFLFEPPSLGSKVNNFFLSSSKPRKLMTCLSKKKKKKSDMHAIQCPHSLSIIKKKK